MSTVLSEKTKDKANEEEDIESLIKTKDKANEEEDIEGLI